MSIKPGSFKHLIGKPMGEVLRGIKQVHERHGEPRGIAMNSIEVMNTLRDIHTSDLIIPVGAMKVIHGPNTVWNKRRPTILDDLGVDMSGH